MSILKGLEQCWMSPTGRIVRKHPNFTDSITGIAWHENLAMNILADKWKMSYDDTFEKVHGNKLDASAYEELEGMGWIRLSMRGSNVPLWIRTNKQLPKKQMITILEWCRENGRNYEKCFAKT